VDHRGCHIAGMGDVLRYMNLPMLGVLGMLLVLLVAALVGSRLRRGDRQAAARVGGRLLLAGALIAVLGLTLLPGHGFRGANLVPGRSIANGLSSANLDLALFNIVGNVVMFIPLGALAGSVFRWRLTRVVAAGLLTSTGIEVVQFAIGRSADIDDIVLNTTGTALGVLLCLVVAHVAGSQRQRAGHPDVTLAS